MSYEEVLESNKPFNRRKYQDGWYKVDGRGMICSTTDLSIRTFTLKDKLADDWWTQEDAEWEEFLANRVRLRCKGKNCPMRDGFWVAKEQKEEILGLKCLICDSDHVDINLVE